MSFIDNMKAGKKRMGRFLIILFILVAVAGIDSDNLQDTAAGQNELYEKMQVDYTALQKDTDAKGNSIVNKVTTEVSRFSV